MRSLRFLALLTAACSVAAMTGCGGKGGPASHATESAVPAAAPTPDTTPVDVLRTPAGLVLKTDQPAPTVTSSPAPTQAKSVS